ncbi:hypothetical protein L596_001896 [Steinernema carpocapsae]|uniref:Uncharacterized protein n=1 Tax=Steinernema carpocapsae TaxID=34508 RepID=A0A4U8URG1_STECR|nr:hypothetical protein L596_001896 [Steinernema carpocapsae]
MRIDDVRSDASTHGVPRTNTSQNDERRQDPQREEEAKEANSATVRSSFQKPVQAAEARCCSVPVFVVFQPVDEGNPAWHSRSRTWRNGEPSWTPDAPFSQRGLTSKLSRKRNTLSRSQPLMCSRHQITQEISATSRKYTVEQWAEEAVRLRQKVVGILGENDGEHDQYPPLQHDRGRTGKKSVEYGDTSPITRSVDGNSLTASIEFPHDLLSKNYMCNDWIVQFSPRLDLFNVYDIGERVNKNLEEVFDGESVPVLGQRQVSGHFRDSGPEAEATERRGNRGEGHIGADFAENGPKRMLEERDRDLTFKFE